MVKPKRHKKNNITKRQFSPYSVVGQVESLLEQYDNRSVNVTQRDQAIRDIMNNRPVPEHISSRLQERPFINVKNSPYNAQGNGIADDRAAIQQAIDDAIPTPDNPSGSVVYIPTGTYKITPTGTQGGLKFRSNVAIKGDGMGLSTLLLDPNYTNDVTGFLRTDFDTAVTNSTLMDISLKGNPTAPGRTIGLFTGPNPNRSDIWDDSLYFHNLEVSDFGKNNGYQIDPHHKGINFKWSCIFAHGTGKDCIAVDGQVDSIWKDIVALGSSDLEIGPIVSRNCLNPVTGTNHTRIDGIVAAYCGSVGIVSQQGSDRNTPFNYDLNISNLLSHKNNQGILIRDTNGCRINNGKVQFNNGTGVEIYGSKNCFMGSLHIHNNWRSGTATASSAEVRIRDRVLTDPPLTYKAQNNTIEGNTISTSARLGFGVRVEAGALDNCVRGNNITVQGPAQPLSIAANNTCPPVVTTGQLTTANQPTTAQPTTRQATSGQATTALGTTGLNTSGGGTTGQLPNTSGGVATSQQGTTSQPVSTNGGTTDFQQATTKDSGTAATTNGVTNSQQTTGRNGGSTGQGITTQFGSSTQQSQQGGTTYQTQYGTSDLVESPGTSMRDNNPYNTVPKAIGDTIRTAYKFGSNVANSAYDLATNAWEGTKGVFGYGKPTTTQPTAPQPETTPKGNRPQPSNFATVTPDRSYRANGINSVSKLGNSTSVKNANKFIPTESGLTSTVAGTAALVALGAAAFMNRKKESTFYSGTQQPVMNRTTTLPSIKDVLGNNLPDIPTRAEQREKAKEDLKLANADKQIQQAQRRRQNLCNERKGAFTKLQNSFAENGARDCSNVRKPEERSLQSAPKQRGRRQINREGIQSLAK